MNEICNPEDNREYKILKPAVKVNWDMKNDDEEEDI